MGLVQGCGIEWFRSHKDFREDKDDEKISKHDICLLDHDQWIRENDVVWSINYSGVTIHYICILFTEFYDM